MRKGQTYRSPKEIMLGIGGRRISDAVRANTPSSEQPPGSPRVARGGELPPQLLLEICSNEVKRCTSCNRPKIAPPVQVLGASMEEAGWLMSTRWPAGTTVRPVAPIFQCSSRRIVQLRAARLWIWGSLLSSTKVC
jgi:hypothetical protein